MIVTIDGPAASGKSSVAFLLSKRLGFVCINSGAAYRVITKSVIDSGLKDEDEKVIAKFLSQTLPSMVISWKTDSEGMRIHCNGKDVTSFLFAHEIDLYVSKVAAMPIVRRSINQTLVSISKNSKNVCFEGRDMGSEVFVNADIKIFLTASVESRAKRRFDQSNKLESLEEIEDKMRKRDALDSSRDMGPLLVPEGAFVFDSSYYSLEDTVDILFDRIKTILGN